VKGFSPGIFSPYPYIIDRSSSVLQTHPQW
jgi:hypothetical protein